MPRVPAVADVDQKKQWILNAAKSASLELANDLILLQLPHSPPLPRCAARPFAAVIRRKFPDMRITAWDDADDGRQPTAYKMPQALAPDYVQWARGIGVPDEKLELPAWLQKCLTEPKQERAAATDDPDFFSQPNSHMLMPYQREGIRFGISRDGKVLLADDMGLGKTVQALGIAWQYRDSFPMLIVCPSSLRNVWEDQIQRWTTVNPEDVQIIFSGATPVKSTARIVVVSYALLGKCQHLQTFHGANYKLVIADECHYIKNPDAQRSQALINTAASAERIILVSGTPVLNTAMELYPLLRLLDSNIQDQSEFAKRYFGAVSMDFGKTKYVDPRREQELHLYLFKTIGIRRKKEDVLKQLPPKTRQTITLAATGGSMPKLKEIEGKLFQPNRSEDMQWWAEYRTASNAVMQIKKRCVGEYVTDVINGGIGKFLLFAHHREMLDFVESVVKERVGGGGYIRIDGSTDQRERGDLVKRFQEDLECHCALLSITALAEGQTLTSAEAIIFAELVWTPGTIDQCEGRAHRIGQQGSVLVQYLLLDSQFDRRCYKRLEQKHHHASKVLDNKDSKFWEESVGLETGKKIAATGLGDRSQSRPKPYTAMGAQPKSRSAPPKPVAPMAPVEGSKEDVEDKATGSCEQKAPERKPVKPVKRVKPKSKSRTSSSSRPSGAVASAAPSLSGEHYKVTDHLHLGLNLKINSIYSKEDLEARCKDSEQKLGRLRYHMKNGEKLQLVDPGFPPAKKARTLD